MQTKILLIEPVWGREALTRLHFEWIHRLCAYNPRRYWIDPLIIVSEQWASALAAEFGFRSVWAENYPIGRKLNEGLRVAIREGWDAYDYMMGMGSDDFIEPSFLDSYAPYFVATPAFGVTEAFFLCAATGQQKTVTIGYPYGAARCIGWGVVKAAAVDRGAYRGLWPDTLNRGLDFYSMQAVAERTEILTTPVKIPERLWDVKMAENINSFAKVGGTRVYVNPSEMPSEIQKFARHASLGI